MERVSSATATEVEDAISTDQSGRSGKKRAKVWAYVDTELIDGVEKAVCKYCKLQLSSVPGKGTTHLNRHIGYYCHHIPQEDRDTFLASLKNTPGRDNSVFDPVVFRGLIAKYFLHGEVAFRKADDPTWREMINYCQPSFNVVGRQTVRADCMMLYEEEKLQLQDKITKLKSHVSLTADLWSSNQTWEFELQKKIIAFKQISYPHNSFAVQDGITACLMEWDLVDRVFSVTLDNASVNNRAIRDLRAALGPQMFFNGEHLHVRCAAHVLNIMVQAGLQVIPNAIKRIRDIIKVATSTPSRLQTVNSIVQTLGLRGKSGLVLDVPHRWNATYDMLHEALKYKAALNRFAAEQFQDCPSEVEWQDAAWLHEFLEQFSDTTKAFSADRHPTAHMFVKMMMAIRDVLLDEAWNANSLLNALAEAMYTKFEKYWAAPSMILLIATVLDPSMKADFVKFYFMTVESAEVQEKMRELKQYLNQYYLERVELAFAQFSSQNSRTRLERSELDLYLDDPRVVVRAGENFNVLAWWKKNSDAYPILSLMARDFLSIPVSTVSSESAFSCAGRILGKNRTSLSPETLEALVCAKDCGANEIENRYLKRKLSHFKI
ncbi:hypothetical protein PVAP13_5KG165914 [Panicum virgatum]|uniref:BED-type domain-containing protein n=1 Tax=Panicum virgatum TaxID=38727 RepID=A0A8T0SJM0_PANVG|nr:hypothetical protein PVAP13_5KG165914 [Panicum virgatum]